MDKIDEQDKIEKRMRDKKKKQLVTGDKLEDADKALENAKKKAVTDD